MPAVTRLSDFEIANVINYIQQKWGNQQYVQINTLQEGLKNCK
jgi:mono/diheme cytochrome c family protein